MYVIYNKLTTELVGGSLNYRIYKTERAAKAFRTRKGLNPDEYGIADSDAFRIGIEKWETKKNLLSGKPFQQRVNTPLCCDPSSETYWSM